MRNFELIYKQLPFTLTSTIEEWINSNETTISKVASGSLNGHYSMKHREDTKKKIGEHTRKLWETDSYAKQRMLEGLRKSGLSQKGKIKIPRGKKDLQELRWLLHCNKNCIKKNFVVNRVPVRMQ